MGVTLGAQEKGHVNGTHLLILFNIHRLLK